MKYLAICDYDGTLANDKISNSTKKYINEFTLSDNLMYVISYEKFDVLKENFFECINNFSYISLTDNKWCINNKIIYKKISYTILNNIINNYADSIYTMYSTAEDISYIYNYQDRLSILYPKRNEIITEFKNDVISLTIAISNSSSSSLKTYLKEQSLYYDEYAKDKNREILIISAMPNTKEEIAKIIINQNNNYISVGIADDINDYKYLKHCNIKIAMLNSNDQLKNLCDITTEYDCNNDGCMLQLISLNNSSHF